MKQINQIVNKFEKIIIIILVVLMGIVVLFSSVELIFFIAKELFGTVKQADLLLDKKELMKIFGLFFNVLIGLELFETVKLYLKEDVFHAEFVLLVALIAVTRKIIILDYEKVSYETLFAYAALIIVLTLGYYLLKRGQRKQIFPNDNSKISNKNSNTQNN